MNTWCGSSVFVCAWWRLIVAVGLGGGALGAAYLRTLELVTDVLGPSEWNDGAHVAVLAVVGVLITVLVRTLGRPADVELLVGNIHVHGMTDDNIDTAGLARPLTGTVGSVR